MLLYSKPMTLAVRNTVIYFGATIGVILLGGFGIVGYHQFMPTTPENSQATNTLISYPP